MTFEQWWSENYEGKLHSGNVAKVVELAFKEVAENAWNGRNSDIQGLISEFRQKSPGDFYGDDAGYADGYYSAKDSAADRLEELLG